MNKIRQRAGLTPLKNVTEADIEKERIKEFGFENGDRLLYLVAMQKTIDGKREIRELFMIIRILMGIRFLQ